MVGRSPSESNTISEDVLQVNQGSLYPALHRLEHQELDRSRVEGV